MLGWSRSVNLERLAIYWPGYVFWAFLWLFPALKLKPHSTVASMLVLISCVIPTMEFEEERRFLVKKVYSFCKKINWLFNWNILYWIFSMHQHIFLIIHFLKFCEFLLFDMLISFSIYFNTWASSIWKFH